MKIRLSSLAVAVGVAFLLASPSLAFGKKGVKIPVGDDPSLKEGERLPELVLVEISDYQCFYCIRSAEQVIPQVYEWLVRRGKVEIVFLPDMVGETPPPAIVAAVEKYAKEIAALRKEIEGNAMLFHAIDSRSLLMRDVLAVSFEDNTATIYAAAKLPQN